VNAHGGLTGEGWETSRERWQAQDATGNALALARWERGQRLTDDERTTLNRSHMWGCAGYPIAKRGRGWVIDSTCYRGGPIFPTKRAAVCAWETFVAMLVSLSGLEAQERHTTESEARP